MILLWGVASDPPLAEVRTRLAERRRNALLLDQRAVLETAAEVIFDETPRGWVSWGGVRLDLGEVRAAYLRPCDPADVPEVRRAGPESPEARHAVEIYEAIRLWAELTPALVVNRLSAGASNSSKPYQGELIRLAGFEVPTTLLTTDPDAAREFCARHRDVIFKSVSGVRSVVARVDDAMRERLPLVASCPTQLQARVPGRDVRVHVVGGDIFACEIESTADDYRYARRQGAAISMRSVELPADCAERSVALARRLGLTMAGIDLRRTPEGAWVCFEVNPSPGFTFFDLDGRIARCVAGHLASAPRRV